MHSDKCTIIRFRQVYLKAWRGTSVFSIAILFLVSLQSIDLHADERSANASKAVIICVHGVLSNGDDSTYGHLKELPGFKGTDSSTLVVDFHWGFEWVWNASQRIGHRYDQFEGISRHQWCAVAKLKNLVAALERDGTIDSNTKVSVLSHSQGTVVTLTALQEGMQIDHWVLMGSPLSQKVVQDGDDYTDFLSASKNVRGVIFNLSSPADDPGGLWNHIGRRGLPQVFRSDFSLKESTTAGRWRVLSSASPIEGQGEKVDSQQVRIWSFGDSVDFNDSFKGIVDIPLRGIDHAGKKGSFWGAGWWSMFWTYEDYSSCWPESISWADVRGFLICKDSVEGFTDVQREHCRALAAVPINRDWNIFSDVSADNLADDTPWGGFGWSAEGRPFIRTFTITKGMETGFHFDDAKAVSFKIECIEGEVEHELKVATWYSWDTLPGEVGQVRKTQLGQSYSGSWESKGLGDKTVYVRLKGRSDTPTRVRCTVMASSTKQPKRPFGNDPSYANEAIELNRSFQLGREPLSTKREHEAADLFGSGMAESVRDIRPEAKALNDQKRPNNRGWDRAVLCSNIRMVALLGDEVNAEASDSLLRSLKYIKPFSDDGSTAGSNDTNAPFSRNADTYWDLLLKQRGDLKTQLDELQKELAIPGQNAEKIKKVEFKFHAGLLELLRTRQLILEEVNEILESRKSSKNLEDVVRFAPGEALANIAIDRANRRLIKTWYSTSPRLKETLSRELQGQADFRALANLLATSLIPPSLQNSGDAIDQTPPRETCDVKEFVEYAGLEDEANWLRTNRKVLTNGFTVLAAAINREARTNAAAIAMERFLSTGGVLKLPTDAVQKGMPHFEFIVTAVGNAQAQGASKSLSCDLFLCLPNTMTTSIERSGGFRSNGNGEDVTNQKGTAERFEKVPLGLNVSGIHIQPEVWGALGKIIWLQQEARIRADMISQRASLSEAEVPAELLSTIELPELENLAIQILSQGLFFQPELGRAAGLWTDRNAPAKLLKRLGIPEAFIGSIKSFDLDRKKLQWIEFIVQMQVPFEEQIIDLPLRIDLSNGGIDEKALASSLRTQLSEKCIQRLNTAARGRSTSFVMTEELSLFVKDFVFILGEESQSLNVDFSASLEFGSPGDVKGNRKVLGKWKFQCRVGNDGSQSVLAGFRIPGTSFKLQLVRADMVEGRISLGSFATEDSLNKQLTELSEQPDSKSLDGIRKTVMDDFSALEIKQASLVPSWDGVRFTALIESTNRRLPSSHTSFALNQAGKELPATALRLLELALKRSMLDWMASQLGTAQEQVLRKLADELPDRVLEIGTAWLKIGKCEVAQHGSKPDAKALKIESIDFRLPEAIAQEPIVVSNLWLVVGSGVTVDSLQAKNVEEAVKQLLRSRTLKLDWKDASIKAPDKWKENAKTIDVSGFRLRLEVPEIVVDSVDGSSPGIGLAVVASIQSDVLPIRLPRLRCLVRVDSDRPVFQQEVGKERWETVSDISEMAWSAAMFELSKAASDGLYGVKCDLLGLGEWTFNEQNEEGREFPCRFSKGTDGGLSVELNGSFDVAGRQAFATVNLLTGAITWDANSSAKALFSDLLSDAVGLPIRIDNPNPIRGAKEVGWSFDILVALGDELGEFKATGVKATTRGLKMPISLSWTSPTPMAVGPMVWLTKPSVRIPLDGSRRIGAQGNMTFPEANMDKIAKVRCTLNIEVEKDRLLADATGTTIFFTMFPVYENRGEIVIANSGVFAELSAETVGVMKAIMTDNQRVTIDTGDGTLSAEGKFGVLGISLANAKLIYGQGNKDMPSSEGPPVAIWIEAKFVLLGTRSEILVIIRDGFGSYDGYASTSLGKVLGVSVGKVESELHEHHSRVKFSALGASLDIHGPGPNDLNGRWIENEIKKLLRDGLKDLLDPERLAQAAEQILKGNVTIQVGGRLGGSPGKPGGGNPSGGGGNGVGQGGVGQGGSGQGGSGQGEGGDKKGDPNGQDKDNAGNGQTDGTKNGNTGQNDHVPNNTSTTTTGERRKIEYATKSGGPFDDIWEEKCCYIKINKEGDRVEIRHTQDVYQNQPEKRPYYWYLPKKDAEAFNQPPLLDNGDYLILPRTESKDEVFRISVTGRWSDLQEKNDPPPKLGVSSIAASVVDLDTILKAQKRPDALDAFEKDLLTTAAAGGSPSELQSFTSFERRHILRRVRVTLVPDFKSRQTDILGFVEHTELGSPSTFYLTKNWSKSYPDESYVAIVTRSTGSEVVRVRSRELPNLHRILSDPANSASFECFAALSLRANTSNKQLNLYELLQETPKSISDFLFSITDKNLPDRLELVTISAEGKESRLVVHEKGIATSLGNTTLQKIPEAFTSPRLKLEFTELASKGEVDCFRQDKLDSGGVRTIITVCDLTKDSWAIRVDLDREKANAQFVAGSDINHEFKRWLDPKSNLVISTRFPYADLSTAEARTALIKILLESRQEEGYQQYFRVNPLGLLNINKTPN